MADFDEARGQDVHEEASDELLVRQCDPVAAFGDEGDPIDIHRDQTVIGEGDPVGVAAEVVEDLLGASEGPLAVDAPVFSVQGPEEIVEAVGILR